MARIAGVNIPDNKHTVISLTYIFGVGRTTAQKICAATGVNPAAKIKDLSDEQIEQLRGEVAKVNTEGDLRREVNMKICLLYTSPSPRDVEESRMPSSA